MIKNFVKRIAAFSGYKIEKQIPFLLEHKNSLIQISFEHILSELITSIHKCKFIQVGSNDGKLNDPLRKFVLKNFLEGIMIEPQSEIFQQLKENYEENVLDEIFFENLAIDKKSGFKTLYTIKNPSNPEDLWAHAAASFDRSHIESMLTEDSKGDDGGCIQKLSVKCETFEYIIDKYSMENLDLLQIDAEGYDFELIKMFPYSQVTPKIIHFEHIHLDHKDREECLKFLLNLGYSFAIEYFDITAVHQN